MFTFKKDVKIHFIGIGGIGMSGIAEVLISLGYHVSGSDVTRSANTEKLQSLGAQVYVGHRAENITDATVVVYSSAVTDHNPEMQEAKKRNIPIMRRAEMLAELMRLKQGLAIAGTHGKTTTTSMLATILDGAGLDPAYIIGGIVRNLGGHAKVGKGEYLVVESDESDGSFLLLNPVMACITNIDDDHMNFYHSEAELYEAFKTFANRVPFYGYCALNAHDKKLMQIKKEMNKPSLTFGVEDEEIKDADFMARHIRYTLEGTFYELLYKGEKVADIRIASPGRHNVLNSLAAISIAASMGIPYDKIARSIQNFEGVGRRFQVLWDKNNLEVIDDYAHHPTAVGVTLKTLRELKPNHRIIAVFEPHRYTRTKDCWNSFFHCFNHADEVYLSPIYPASETPIEGISSDRLAADINRLHPKLIQTLGDISDLKNILNKKYDQKTVIITLGAGSIGKKIREYVGEWN